jgi:hypothetical protein
MSRSALRILACVVATACAASVGRTQTPPRRAVRLQVSDTSGAPLGGVNVVVLNVQRDTVGRGTTDDNGRALVAVDSGAGDRQVVARRIGFVRSDIFLRLVKPETLAVSLTLRRVVATLAPVTVTERRRTPYDYINADEIDSMSTKRTIFEARDIVLKLRPDMMGGRSPCGIGGVSVRRTAVTNAGRVSRIPNPGLGGGVTVWVNGRRIFSPGIPTDSVLAQIRAEHVSEIKYENCQSTVIAKNGGNNAIFVTLKAGVAFDLKYGSFVVDSDSMLKAINRRP